VTFGSGAGTLSKYVTVARDGSTFSTNGRPPLGGRSFSTGKPSKVVSKQRPERTARAGGLGRVRSNDRSVLDNPMAVDALVEADGRFEDGRSVRRGEVRR
jgi:hypothetical protein